MTVDPELQVVLDLVNAQGDVDPREAGPVALREGFAALALLIGAPRQDVTVEDLVLQGRSDPLAVRRYDAPDRASGAALVWFHGGGWVIGSVDTHEALCRDLAAATGAVVFSVDYRLAPEHPFPAAADDAVDATSAIITEAGRLGVHPARVAVGGDSAGGQLATVVARRLRDLGGPMPAAQVLVYPVTDLAGTAGEHPSRHENGTGYLLTEATMDYFADCYVPDRALRTDPDLSPLRTPDLSGLPPALVITSEYDPLRDEGEAYAAALRRAGVDVVAERHDGTIHLFIQLRTTRCCQDALDQIGSFVAERV